MRETYHWKNKQFFQGFSLVLLIDLMLGVIDLYHFHIKKLKEPIFFSGGNKK